jgi:hypothetical protein
MWISLKKSLKMNSERALMRKEFCSRFWVRYHKIGVAACKEKGMGCITN